MSFGMAWYRKDQWELLKLTAADSENIEDTYEEWEKQAIFTLKELEKRGSDVSINEQPELNVEMGQDKILLDISQSMTVEKNSETRTFKNFDVEIKSPLYNLALVSLDIVEQEAEHCYFSYEGYNAFYPRYVIRPDSLSNSNVIYTIKDKNSEKEFSFAIRGCAVSAGI